MEEPETSTLSIVAEETEFEGVAELLESEVGTTPVLIDETELICDARLLELMIGVLLMISTDEVELNVDVTIELGKFIAKEIEDKEAMLPGPDRDGVEGSSIQPDMLRVLVLSAGAVIVLELDESGGSPL